MLIGRIIQQLLADIAQNSSYYYTLRLDWMIYVNWRIGRDNGGMRFRVAEITKIDGSRIELVLALGEPGVCKALDLADPDISIKLGSLLDTACFENKQNSLATIDLAAGT